MAGLAGKNGRKAGFENPIVRALIWRVVKRAGVMQ